MGQRHPHSASEEQAWLSQLVNTFERAEQLSYESCDPAIIFAVKARLDKPAATGTRCTG